MTVKGPSSTLSAFWNVALIAFGFFVSSMVNLPMTFTPSEPNISDTVTNSTLHAEVQGPVCGTEIGRLKAVMNKLEARYGYDELRRGIRHGGQVIFLILSISFYLCILVRMRFVSFSMSVDHL